MLRMYEERCALLILLAGLCYRLEKLGNGENWHSTVVSLRCFQIFADGKEEAQRVQFLKRRLELKMKGKLHMHMGVR